MKVIRESGDEWPVNIVIDDPDQVMWTRPGKTHAIRFETSPGQRSVILLSDDELVNLICKARDRWKKEILHGD